MKRSEYQNLQGPPCSIGVFPYMWIKLFIKTITYLEETLLFVCVQKPINVRSVITFIFIEISFLARTETYYCTVKWENILFLIHTHRV